MAFSSSATLVPSVTNYRETSGILSLLRVVLSKIIQFFGSRGTALMANDLCSGIEKSLSDCLKAGGSALVFGYLATRDLECVARLGLKITEVKTYEALKELATCGQKFELVVSEYQLNHIARSMRSDVMRDLQEVTAINGINVIRVLSDPAAGPGPDSLHIFDSRELECRYEEWQVIDSFEGLGACQCKQGVCRTHSDAFVFAKKRYETGDRFTYRNSKLIRLAMIALVMTCLNSVLCMLGYTKIGGYSIATLWPGTIFQAITSIAFGGWGILISIVSGIVADAIKYSSTPNIFFIFADFFQSFLPALYFRRLLATGAWRTEIMGFFRFAFMGVIVPRAVGGMIAGVSIAMGSNKYLWEASFDWFWSGVPIGLLIGWPLFRVLMPQLVREGWTIKGWWY